MSFTDPTIHVYANGHGFVVVPVLIDAAGHEVEGTPANLAALTLGRPTTLTLTKALRSAREQSAAGQSDTCIAWDGDNGKWWAHHLFKATIVWHADAVVITSEPRGKTSDAILPRPKQAGLAQDDQSDAHEVSELPADAPASEIAEWLIRHLGELLG